MIALGVTLFTVSTGLLLGFVPKTYVSADYASDPLAQLGALVIRELLTQSICVYFIWRAWQGRLWKLSIAMLQIIALLAFAVLPCSMLSHGGPIHLDTILTNSLYLLLTGLIGSLVIFFIGQEEAVEDTGRAARPGAVVHPRRQRRPIGSIVYAIVGLYCCLLPRSFGRSVFFPLFDTENDFALFIIVFSDLLFVAVAAFLSLCLRAAIDERHANEQIAAFYSAKTPDDFTRLRLTSMRRSVAELGRRYKLSQRELEVLTLYALGYTQKRVASELFISPETVHTHIKNIYLKTNMCSRQKILDYLDKIG
jgi:DNA-binding CsgD family transcriptional regulator